MKGLYVIPVVAAALLIRVTIYLVQRRRRSAGGERAAPPTTSGVPAAGGRFLVLERALGDVGLVAGREIRERIRGRIFRVGTVLMLLGIGAAIVIPTLTKNGAKNLQTVGVVGTSGQVEQIVRQAARATGVTVHFVAETSAAAATADLHAGKVDLSIVDASSVLLEQPLGSGKSKADAGLVNYVAQYLGIVHAYEVAGLTPAQAAVVSNAKAVPVTSLVGQKNGTLRTTSVVGLVLLFFMLTQYCTWILIGVMQEKSSRVVEVLLAMVRPIQLLGGKVLGIGALALGQALVLVGFALALGAAVGSDLLHGSGPMEVLAEFVWLVVGYAFYCWVYAAAGSTAERQDQVQTLALPLSLPILFGYVYSITVASSGSPTIFFKVLAYMPPTAPFCMSVLVALNQVAWWQFVGSVLITLATTVAVAVFAARIYRRAVLRTGGRVRISELLGRTAR